MYKLTDQNFDPVSGNYSPVITVAPIQFELEREHIGPQSSSEDENVTLSAFKDRLSCLLV